MVRVIREFFQETGDPINLAVFRIIFYLALFSAYLSTPSAIWFSRLPSELIIPPQGLGWLLPHLPIDETTVRVASIAFIVFCCTGLLGYFSRISSFLVLILGFYVLGVPQFYGKIDHCHHFLWFAAILAVSRCGDVLSIDAVIGAWKKGKYSGRFDSPEPSQMYALPLRFVWLLIGVIYLFPGLWKLHNPGFQWIFSDNLKYHLYSKWIELDHWRPIFRLDQYPILCQLGALWTVTFEVSFVVMIFFRKLRPPLALAGIIFHESARTFMRISFFHLYIFYTTLFDWASILRALGPKLFGQVMYIVYDGNCKICKRTIGSLKAFDVFGRISYVNALDRRELEEYGLSNLDSNDLLRDMHAVVGSRVFKGFYSYRALATRIPVLWPVLPFLWLWPITSVGNRIYRSVADHRACEIPPSHHDTPGRMDKAKMVWVVGIFLLVVNGSLGFRSVIAAWPFACYPTFAWIQGPEQDILQILIVKEGGETVEADLSELTRQFTPTKLWWLVRQTLWWSRDDLERTSRLRALWQVITRIYPDYQNCSAVRFQKLTLSTIPEEANRNPLRVSIIYEMKVR